MNIINSAQAMTAETTDSEGSFPLVGTEEHTAVPAEEGGVLASLGINGQQLIFQWVNFAVVAVVLWFLILKPLTKKMTERQKMIDDSIENAKKIQDNLARSEKDYQHRIDQAKVEANKILDKATAEAAGVGQEMKINAQKEIEQLVERAKKNIKAEKDEMSAGLQAETANLVMAALEKILREKVDSKKNQTLVEDALKELR